MADISLMRENNKQILANTLSICEKGYYDLPSGNRVNLKLSQKEMMDCKVYLPKDIEEIRDENKAARTHVIEIGARTRVSCKNMDSFSCARKCAENESYRSYKNQEQRVLVLNLANAIRPGGGVRNGARAQEEDLCRKSSLLVSLESSNAAKYYEFNKNLYSLMGSDGIIITPNVEIIKDDKGNLLEDTVIVSVMTCAAPCIKDGLEGMTQNRYKALIFNRITGMLTIAAYLGYKRIVLGAFGCGVFGNDAKVVSDLFYSAMKAFEYDGLGLSVYFNRIDFAVLDKSENQYNYNEFSRNFNDFYKAEENEAIRFVNEKKKKYEANRNQIRGSLFGGAVGDALGYQIEFYSEPQIFEKYGAKGITEYELSRGKALISDDTQMALFTANGILMGDTREKTRGIGGWPASGYVAYAYDDWYLTQNYPIEEINKHDRYTQMGGRSWLLDVPELYSRRAPGNTCLGALENRNDEVYDYIGKHVNNSKGCGGIMRVAPLALCYRPGINFFANIEELDREAAQIAAITHGHSLGYMPAAVLVHIISRILTDGKTMTLKEIVEEARDTIASIFAGDKHLDELVNIINLAIELSENNATDLDNIHKLGQGWVAEETLAIALYCSLKYQDDFSKAITAAVNHEGDSDSTGAVTGNIVGALLGYDAIEDKWKKNLELADVILEMADDLCYGCQLSEYGLYEDPVWEMKYIKMHRVISK